MKNLIIVALMLLTFTLTAQVKEFNLTKYENHTLYSNDSIECVVYNHGGTLFSDKYGYPAFRFEKWVDNTKELLLVFYGPIDKYWVELYDYTSTSIVWNTYTLDFQRKTAVDWVAEQSIMRSYLKNTVQIVHPSQFNQLIQTYNEYNFNTNAVRSRHFLPKMPR
jgi:hypothetical protein